MDLDEEILAHQPIHHQKRVWRVLSVREELGKLACAILHERGNPLGMNHVGRELDDVRKSRAGRLQGLFQVREDLRALVG